MYYYLYDPQLSDKKYNNITARIETRLTDLGINGKINRLSFLKNINQLLFDEIKRGVKTVIIVGDDKTIGQVINLVADFNITIGLIPIGSDNNIARLLGVPLGEEACDVISSRIIKKIDLGKINNYLINLSEGNNTINISNLNYCYNSPTDPLDSQLDVFIENVQKKLLRKAKSTLSHFKNATLKITGDKTVPILINDEKKIVKTPAEVIVVPKKLKIIVGKGRYF